MYEGFYLFVGCAICGMLIILWKNRDKKTTNGPGTGEGNEDH